MDAPGWLRGLTVRTVRIWCLSASFFVNTVLRCRAARQQQRITHNEVRSHS